ncbi:MAG: glyoxylate/hydroxypyruvate reductase A [Colwellia sp.]|uniref:2-hydroxyacid dehydrogenase n=1 Tax=Colwellia sp. TaxID=56799 RepID=UPI001DCEC0C3|nr:glyoxylate/hydroxypyruvate reductase A [Colwellia sp.]NQY48633.1 glyoxylate/hydroxypyruvate reductase A [Colwellia sp.]
MNNIVFISGSESATKSQWLAEIQKQLINETIRLPEEISDSQAKHIDIAIVANPDPSDLARFPNLVWIQSLWAGVERLVGDVIDKPVKLVKLNDPQLAKTMAESVLAWTLYLQRNMPEYAQQQVNKQWRQLPCITSAELRVSVLGAGALGITALNTLKKLDYQVSCWSRTAKQFDGIKNYLGSAGLHTMLSKTDILINLLPLTPETYHLLGKELLSNLPKGAKLINFSRGAVIDTKALLNLLENGHIAHAVLDVFEHEPLAPTDAIWTNPNITVLPHISAPTNMLSAAKVIAKNILMYRENNVIPNYVDVKQGY